MLDSTASSVSIDCSRIVCRMWSEGNRGSVIQQHRIHFFPIFIVNKSSLYCHLLQPLNARYGSSNMKFLPEVAVRDDGTVAVLYYDFHTDVFGDSTLDTDIHVAFFDQDLNVQGIQTITPAFDLRQAPYAYGYFPGDYVGFTTDGTDFLAAFTMTHNLGLPVDIPDETLEVDTANRQDVYFARITWP